MEAVCEQSPLPHHPWRVLVPLVDSLDQYTEVHSACYHRVVLQESSPVASSTFLVRENEHVHHAVDAKSSLSLSFSFSFLLKERGGEEEGGKRNEAILESRSEKSRARSLENTLSSNTALIEILFEIS